MQVNEIQELILYPKVEYVDEPDELPMIDLVVNNFGSKVAPGLRLTFTEESIRTLIQKAVDLTGWELLPKPEIATKSTADIDYALIDSKNRTGIDGNAIRKARG